MVFIKGTKIDLTVDDTGMIDLLNSEASRDGSQLRLPLLSTKQNDKNNLILSITFNAGGKPLNVGRVSLENINYVNRVAELKIFVDDKHKKKGIGKEACDLIIKHGFEELNLRRIECGTLETNIGMQKLAESLNFSEEGRRKEAVYKNGQYIDVVEYGLMKEV